MCASQGPGRASSGCLLEGAGLRRRRRSRIEPSKRELGRPVARARTWGGREVRCKQEISRPRCTFGSDWGQALTPVPFSSTIPHLVARAPWRLAQEPRRPRALHVAPPCSSSWPLFVHVESCPFLLARIHDILLLAALWSLVSALSGLSGRPFGGGGPCGTLTLDQLVLFGGARWLSRHLAMFSA